jgi:hypothetical protein
MDKIGQCGLLQLITYGMMSDTDWPFYWDLRDYTNVCYGFPEGCTDGNPKVMIGVGDDIVKTQIQYTARIMNDSRDRYIFHRIPLCSWWNDGL